VANADDADIPIVPTNVDIQLNQKIEPTNFNIQLNQKIKPFQKNQDIAS
jgi:hypothetical protein